MGATLACGIAATVDADGWIIALGDMPWIAPATMQRDCVRRWRLGRPYRRAVVSRAARASGWFSRRHRDALSSPHGRCRCPLADRAQSRPDDGWTDVEDARACCATWICRRIWPSTTMSVARCRFVDAPTVRDQAQRRRADAAGDRADGVQATATGIFPIRFCHSRGPVSCTDVARRVDRDRDRHVLDVELVDRLHPEIGERDDARPPDRLRHEIGGAADGHQVGRADACGSPRSRPGRARPCRSSR